MRYTTILVQANGGADPTGRIQLAAGLAAESGAELIGAAVRLPTPMLEFRARGNSVLAFGLDNMTGTLDPDSCRDAEAAFFRTTRAFHIETAWRAAIDFPASALADMASAADLVVAGCCGRPVDEPVDAGELIMRAGRPVLVVPKGVDTLGTGPAVVAWKNTREARRALADSLPLLKRARSVTLVHVEEARSDPVFADPISFLARHGIAAEGKTAGATRMFTGEQIARAANEHHADLIVLGAYGHSRAREWIFGGVTRDLLSHCTVPCLFSR